METKTKDLGQVAGSRGEWTGVRGFCSLPGSVGLCLSLWFPGLRGLLWDVNRRWEARGGVGERRCVSVCGKGTQPAGEVLST